jgi:hypothetical protein
MEHREVLMELAALLDEAQSAPPARRIEWRDRIAAHGDRAIEGVRPWLADGVLAAFAVRVIERVGTNGEPALASQVLRSARPRMPSSVTDDVTWALQRLKAASRAETPRPPKAATASLAGAALRERPRLVMVARRRR